MKVPFPFVINPRQFAFIVLGFIIATIVGTISHEAGHYIPAKLYGFNPRLHYQMVSYGKNAEEDNFRKFYEEHKIKIDSPGPSTEKTRFAAWQKEGRDKGFICTLGGPLQTMITGSIGFFLLWLNRKKIRLRQSMKAIDWVMVFLCFFWSRQLANMLIWTTNYIITGEVSHRGDEIKMSRYLFSLERDSSVFALGSISYITGIIAAVILTYTVFYIIPRQHRFTFICAGIFGSVSGWMIWMEILGPAILPV